MTWFDWLAAWDESVVFGVAMVMLLLGVECVVLARKVYLRTRPVLEEGALLGAEFGVFSAPGAKLMSDSDVPRNCYLLAGSGAISFVAAFTLLALAFGT